MRPDQKQLEKFKAYYKSDTTFASAARLKQSMWRESKGYKKPVLWLTDIRAFYSQLTDSVAKKYSKNGRFVLHGLCYKNKEPTILYKRL